MKILIYLIISAILFLISYQDFKDKRFWVFLPILLFIAGFANGIWDLSWKFWITIILVNVGIVSFLLLLLLVVLRVLGKKSRKRAMGSGDILLMYGLTSVVFPLGFALVIVMSSLIGILFTLLSHKSKEYEIPLAAIMSITVLLLSLLHFYFKIITFIP